MQLLKRAVYIQLTWRDFYSIVLSEESKIQIFMISFLKNKVCVCVFNLKLYEQEKGMEGYIPDVDIGKVKISIQVEMDYIKISK